MRRGPVSPLPAGWPVSLDLILEAARRECPPGHAEALRAFLDLAVVQLPARGLFDPASSGSDELFTAFERIGRDHLSLGEARRAWRTALRRAALPVDRRDELERAALLVQASSDSASYYAGLAFGLAVVLLFGPR